MIRMNIDDFIYEVKEEMLCYDEIGETGADNWEKEFKTWLESPGKKENVSGSGDNAKFLIGDESEIFDIADSYLNAIESNKKDEYWENFQ